MGYFILSNPVQDSIDSLLRRPCRRFDLLSEPVGGGAASSASWTESICRLHTAFAIVQRPIQRRGATGILTHASPTGTQQFLAGENACHQSLVVVVAYSQRRPSRRCTTMSTFLMVYCYFVSTVYSPFDVFYILIFMFFLHFIPCCASASVIMCIKVPYLLTYGRHASRGLQSDGWNRFVAGRATCSVDDHVGDATCGQEVGWVIRWRGACLPVIWASI